MRTAPAAAIAASTTLMLAGAAAQVPHSDGPLAGTATSLSVRAGGGLDPETTWFKGVGFAPAAPHVWSAPAAAVIPRPNLSMAAVLRELRPMCPPAGPVDIDAFSLGLDQIWGNDLGEVEPPVGSATSWPWSVLVFSVDPNAGAPLSVIAGERDRHDAKAGAHGDLFAHVLQGSGIPAELVGQTFRALDATEAGLGPADDVDGVDLHMRLYELDDALLGTVLARAPFARTPTIYFSVSQATLPSVPPAWWGGTPPSGATIFQSRWLPMPSRWSCPTVFRSAADLGLGAGEDIVALAVDQTRECMLFSQMPSAARVDPLMFYGWGPTTTTASPVPYTYALDDDTVTLVSTTLGITPDDVVDALCNLDPGLTGQSALGTSNSFAFGTPLPRNLCLWNRNLASSAFRDVDASGRPSIRAFALGWPTAVATPGFALAFLWGFNSTVGCGAFAPPPITVPFARNPANPICGDPVQLRAPVPRMPIATANTIVVEWVALDAMSVFSEFVTSFPTAFALPHL